MFTGFAKHFGTLGIGAAALLSFGCSGNNDDFLAPPAAVGPTGGQPMPTATPPPPAAAPASDPGPFSLRPGEQLVNHRIVKGDSIWELAQKYKTSESRIKAANGLTSDTIIAGRTIKIPTKQSGAVAAPAPAPVSTTPAAAPTTPAPAAARGFTPLTTPAPPAPVTPPPSAVPPVPEPPATPKPGLNFGTPPPSSAPKIQN